MLKCSYCFAGAVAVGVVAGVALLLYDVVCWFILMLIDSQCGPQVASQPSSDRLPFVAVVVLIIVAELAIIVVVVAVVCCCLF